MINLINKTVEIKPGVVERIIKFEVWFVTPFGLFGDLDMAIAQCVAQDLDPNQSIKGVPAAVTETSYEIG